VRVLEVLDAAVVEHSLVLARLLVAIALAALPLMTAGIPVAAQPSGSPAPASSTRNFSPNPRNVHVRPSVRPSSSHVSQSQRRNRANPYAPQPYLQIDSATMNRILASPHPTPTPRRKPPSSFPTPQVFEHYDNRQSP
jgi:hypothetical protein